MDDYAPPSAPPPSKTPEVPAGWVARWNEQYKEWFYVNIYTKKSQWQKPTAPVFPPDEHAPDDPPPSYEPGKKGPAPTDSKKDLGEDRAAAAHAATSGGHDDDDAKLAAKLQAEEDAKAHDAQGGLPQPPAGYGAAGAYPPSSSPFPQGGGPYAQDAFPQDLPPRERDRAKGGFLGKLFGKSKTPTGDQPAGYGGYSPQPPPQGYYQSPPPPQQPQQYGAYGSQAYSPGPPGPGYGAGPGYGGAGAGAYGNPGGYGGGYGGGQPGYLAPQQQAGRKPGMSPMGMGLAGGALGLGAGMLGGSLISGAMHHNDQGAYMEGYEDGQDGGDFDGGGFDGGDF